MNRLEEFFLNIASMYAVEMGYKAKASLVDNVCESGAKHKAFRSPRSRRQVLQIPLIVI